MPAYAQGDLKTCAAIADATARLACFDALAAQSAAPAAPAPAPQTGAFGLPQAVEEPKELSAHLASALEDPQKVSLITLDNGQVWKLTESPGAYYAKIEAGGEVTVGLSAFGGYRMLIKPIGRTLRVKRVK